MGGTDRYDTDDEGDCPICFATPAGGMMRTFCGHQFCAECLFQHVSRDIRCPMCRVTLSGSEPALPRRREDSVLLSAQNTHMGITIHSRGGVVTVTKLCYWDEGYRAGLRPGNRIASINGIPVRSHRQCIAVLDQAHKLATIPIVFEIVRQPTCLDTWRGWWRRLRRAW